MSAVKPIIRSVADAVLTGFRHADDKLPDLTRRIDDHLDAIKTTVKKNDAFDEKPDLPSGPHRPDGPVRDRRYRRPSGWRKDMRDTVWEGSRRVDGNVRDPETTAIMDLKEPWVMGHKPGYEFRWHQRSAQDRGISRAQFLDEHNNAAHLRPEQPSTSSGHQHELPWEDYKGP